MSEVNNERIGSGGRAIAKWMISIGGMVVYYCRYGRKITDS
jgi:hypothetical protein